MTSPLRYVRLCDYAVNVAKKKPTRLFRAGTFENRVTFENVGSHILEPSQQKHKCSYDLEFTNPTLVKVCKL